MSQSAIFKAKNDVMSQWSKVNTINAVMSQSAMIKANTRKMGMVVHCDTAVLLSTSPKTDKHQYLSKL